MKGIVVPVVAARPTKGDGASSTLDLNLGGAIHLRGGHLISGLLYSRDVNEGKPKSRGHYKLSRRKLKRLTRAGRTEGGTADTLAVPAAVGLLGDITGGTGSRQVSRSRHVGDTNKVARLLIGPRR